MTRETKLTAVQRRVLDVFLLDFTIRSRDWFVSDRTDDPLTIGVRDAFDWLLENGMIEPITQYRITALGRSALSRTPKERT